MATTAPVHPAHDSVDGRRRRPFSTWVKKLTNFNKTTHPGDASTTTNRPTNLLGRARKERDNNPYLESSNQAQQQHSPSPATAAVTGPAAAAAADSRGSLSTTSDTSLDRRNSSTDSESPAPATANNGGGGAARSTAGTISIVGSSHMASSITGTSRTTTHGDSRRGGDSTFSSPAPSERSMTTTLTTIQSLAPNLALPGPTHQQHNHPHHQQQHSNSTIGNHAVSFDQPFPSQSPASAIPPHLAPSTYGPGHPTTYQTATANNLLTDNASVLTLASSSKRRRRRSIDTDASVRALAPSSLWGGSRESLPLSVLSANVDAGMPTTPSIHHAGSSRVVGAAPVERTSIYSAAPAIAGDRNSFYAKQGSILGDGASVRSGLLGHGRADSINGSTAGLASPLASPRENNDREVS